MACMRGRKERMRRKVHTRDASLVNMMYRKIPDDVSIITSNHSLSEIPASPMVNESRPVPTRQLAVPPK